MRHGGTAKQCLRVGPGRYCGGCGHTGANANCLADSRLKRYSVRGDFTNTHSDCDACIANAHRYSYSYTDTCIAYTYTDFNPAADSNSKGTSSTQGSPDAASSADTVRGARRWIGLSSRRWRKNRRFILRSPTENGRPKS